MILARVVRRMVRAWRGSEPPAEWEYLPEGWRIHDPRVKGWNVDSIVETQRAKWPEVLRLTRGTGPLPMHLWAADLSKPTVPATAVGMAYGYVLALAARQKARISLLDWGGGTGHYKLISEALLPQVTIDYHCKDVPLLCKAGRQLQPSGTFYDNDDECFARDYDLVLANGSLEYSEDWKSVAARLAAVSRRYLYVGRLPIVHHGASFTAIQRPSRHGYVTEYVSWVLNRQEFLSYVEGLGMTLIREILVGEGPAIRGAPERCEFVGFLFAPAGSPDAR
jgi:putative methyltransferase (TIGR04325 family)